MTDDRFRRKELDLLHHVAPAAGGARVERNPVAVSKEGAYVGAQARFLHRRIVNEVVWVRVPEVVGESLGESWNLFWLRGLRTWYCL